MKEETRAAFTVTNEGYVKYAYTLGRSLKKHNPHVEYIVHGVNISLESRALLESIPARVRDEHKVFETKQEEISYAANGRMAVLVDILNEGFDKVLYLDADSIVRKPLSGLWKMLDRDDLLLFKQQRVKTMPEEALYKVYYANGIVPLRNTQAVKAFALDWMQRAAPIWKDFYASQISFISAVGAANGVRFGELPFSYIDWEFSFSSHIWVGKGAKKEESTLYILEDRRYTSQQTFLEGFSLTLQQLQPRAQLVLKSKRNQLIRFLLEARRLLLGKKAPTRGGHSSHNR